MLKKDDIYVITFTFIFILIVLLFLINNDTKYEKNNDTKYEKNNDTKYEKIKLFITITFSIIIILCLYLTFYKKYEIKKQSS